MEHDLDLVLVTRVVDGDLAATRDFVARVASVRHFLARRLDAQRRDDLDDLVQATYCALWRKLPQYRGEASIETWACSFARLELVRARDSAARRRERTSAELDTDLSDVAFARIVDPDCGSTLESALLDEVLTQLTGRVAHVVGLRHVEGLTFREIARRLAASTSTVKSVYYRGLGRLREGSLRALLEQDHR